GRPWLSLGIVLALTITTSLPWFASQMMPDVLFPAGVLAIYLLAFGDLRLGERIALCAVIAFAVVSHMALLALLIGIVGALALARLLKVSTAPRLSLAPLPCAAGLVLAPVSNLLITGQFALTPGGASFLFGRLLEDGIITRYLDERCPTPSLRICAHREGLSSGHA